MYVCSFQSQSVFNLYVSVRIRLAILRALITSMHLIMCLCVLLQLVHLFPSRHEFLLQHFKTMKIELLNILLLLDFCNIIVHPAPKLGCIGVIDIVGWTAVATIPLHVRLSGFTQKT